MLEVKDFGHLRLYCLDGKPFDRVIVSFSGGKDSTCLILQLLEMGIDKSQIEIWHQSVDGFGEHHTQFFDWPTTDQYVQKFCDHFGLTLTRQWRAFGFKGELYRENALTNDVYYQEPDSGKIKHLPTKGGKLSTRRKFPAKSPSLSTRWCSAYLKIDVARRVLTDRFKKGLYLFITGERGEESPQRAKYNVWEEHQSSNRERKIFQFRPLLHWVEKQVWELIEKFKIRVHAAYYLGLSRLSCMSCIFFSPIHWAILNEVNPSQIDLIEFVEKEFGFTLDNKKSIREMIGVVTSHVSQFMARQAIINFSLPIIATEWILPAGAYGHGGGSV